MLSLLPLGQPVGYRQINEAGCSSSQQIASLHESSKEQCANACTANTTCLSFNSKASGACYLYRGCSYTCDSAILRLPSGNALYVKEAPPHPPPFYIAIDDTDCSLARSMTWHGSEADIHNNADCASKCDALPHCESFHWLQLSPTECSCVIFSSCGWEPDRHARPNATLYVKINATRESSSHV